MTLQGLPNCGLRVTLTAHDGFQGQHYQGNKFLTNLRLIYMAFKADLKARMQCHQLSEYYRCKKCCDRCGAVQPMDSQHYLMTYKNMAINAPFAATCKDHDEYIRTATRLSPWCAVEGFQFETIAFDTMHLIYLGIAKNHVPSCFKLLKLWGYHYEPGETDDQFLKRLSIEMKQDCKERKSLAKTIFLCLPKSTRKLFV